MFRKVASGVNDKNQEVSRSTLQSVQYMRRRRTTWAIGAALLIALGTTGAVLGAGAIARDSAQKSLSSVCDLIGGGRIDVEARHPT